MGMQRKLRSGSDQSCYFGWCDLERVGDHIEELDLARGDFGVALDDVSKRLDGRGTRS